MFKIWVPCHGVGVWGHNHQFLAGGRSPCGRDRFEAVVLFSSCPALFLCTLYLEVWSYKDVETMVKCGAGAATQKFRPHFLWMKANLSSLKRKQSFSYTETTTLGCVSSCVLFSFTSAWSISDKGLVTCSRGFFPVPRTFRDLLQVVFKSWKFHLIKG